MFADNLSTPCLVLDRDRLERNTERMVERARAAGVALRPHMKTAKSVDVGHLATAGRRDRITVSTLAEADHFAAHGFSDITYAVCVAPHKLPRVAAIQHQHGAMVRLITDSKAGAEAVAHAASDMSTRFDVLIEIDSGEHRTGLAPDSEAVLEIATVIHRAPSASLGGVLTHAGHSYECTSIEQIQDVAEQERLSVTTVARRLGQAGLPCPTVSIGSTPTVVHARSFDGVTEIRPGVYTLFDLAQAGRGSCSPDDIAVSVLATVIGHQREHGRLIIDAGGLALSKDTSANQHVGDAGYGWVCDAESCTRISDLRVTVADQEHGYVMGNIPWDRLPYGSKVRVLPNHACMTAAGHTGYHVVAGGHIVGRWPRISGW